MQSMSCARYTSKLIEANIPDKASPFDILVSKIRASNKSSYFPPSLGVLFQKKKIDQRRRDREEMHFTGSVTVSQKMNVIGRH